MSESNNNLSWLPVVGTAINAWSQERSFEENANQARIQREWQEEMWNKNNAYNTPLAQKQRLEAAGINPYSVLAQGGADTGVSSSPPQSYQRAEANFSNPMGSTDMISGLLALQDYKLKQVDIDKGHADMEFYRIRQVKELIKLDAEISEILANKNLSNEQRDYLESQRQVLNGSIQSLISKNDAESRSASITAANLQRRFNDEHYESASRTLLNKWHVRLSKSQMSYLQQGIKESLARIQRMEFENKLTAQMVETEVQRAANYFADSVNKWTQNPKIAADSKFADELAQTMIDYYDAMTAGAYVGMGNSVLDQFSDFLSEYNVLNNSGEVQTSRRYVRDNQGHITEIHDSKKGSSKSTRKRSKLRRRR